MPEDDADPGKGASPEPAKSPSPKHVSLGLGSYILRLSVPLEGAREALPPMQGILLAVQGPFSLLWGGKGQTPPQEHFTDSSLCAHAEQG